MEDNETIQTPFVGARLRQRYQLNRVLAHGAVATVYLGEDTNLNRPIAVKAVPPASAEAYRAALHATATIAHPAAIMALDAVEDNGWFFIIQEFVDGDPLAGQLDRGLSSERAVTLGLQLVRLLLYAHQRGVIHGDITPSAILIEKDGTARLNNFCVPADAAYFAPYPAVEARLEGVFIGTGGLVPQDRAPLDLSIPGGDLRAVGLLLWQTLATASPSGELRDFRADVPSDVRDIVTRMVVRNHPYTLADPNELLATLEVAGAISTQRRVQDLQDTPSAVRGYRANIERVAPWSGVETQFNLPQWPPPMRLGSGIAAHLAGATPGTPGGAGMVPGGNPWAAPQLDAIASTDPRHSAHFPAIAGPIEEQMTVTPGMGDSSPYPPSPLVLYGPPVTDRMSVASGPARAPRMSGPLGTPLPDNPGWVPVGAAPARAPRMSGPLADSAAQSGVRRAPRSGALQRQPVASGQLRTPAMTGPLRAYGPSSPIESYRVQSAVPWNDNPDLWVKGPGSQTALSRSRPLSLLPSTSRGVWTLVVVGAILFVICFVVGYFTPFIIPLH